MSAKIRNLLNTVVFDRSNVRVYYENAKIRIGPSAEWYKVARTFEFAQMHEGVFACEDANVEGVISRKYSKSSLNWTLYKPDCPVQIGNFQFQNYNIYVVKTTSINRAPP